MPLEIYLWKKKDDTDDYVSCLRFSNKSIHFFLTNYENYKVNIHKELSHVFNTNTILNNSFKILFFKKWTQDLKRLQAIKTQLSKLEINYFKLESDYFKRLDTLYYSFQVFYRVIYKDKNKLRELKELCFISLLGFSCLLCLDVIDFIKTTDFLFENGNKIKDNHFSSHILLAFFAPFVLAFIRSGERDVFGIKKEEFKKLKAKYSQLLLPLKTLLEKEGFFSCETEFYYTQDDFLKNIVNFKKVQNTFQVSKNNIDLYFKTLLEIWLLAPQFWQRHKGLLEINLACFSKLFEQFYKILFKSSFYFEKDGISQETIYQSIFNGFLALYKHFHIEYDFVNHAEFFNQFLRNLRRLKQYFFKDLPKPIKYTFQFDEYIFRISEKKLNHEVKRLIVKSKRKTLSLVSDVIHNTLKSCSFLKNEFQYINPSTTRGILVYLSRISIKLRRLNASAFFLLKNYDDLRRDNKALLSRLYSREEFYNRSLIPNLPRENFRKLLKLERLLKLYSSLNYVYQNTLRVLVIKMIFIVSVRYVYSCGLINESSQTLTLSKKKRAKILFTRGLSLLSAQALMHLFYSKKIGEPKLWLKEEFPRRILERLYGDSLLKADSLLGKLSISSKHLDVHDTFRGPLDNEEDVSFNLDLSETFLFLAQGLFLYLSSEATVYLLKSIWTYEDFYEQSFEISDLKRKPPLSYIDTLLKTYKVLIKIFQSSKGDNVGEIYSKNLLMEDYLKYCLFIILLYFDIKKKNSKLYIPLNKLDRAVVILATQIYKELSSRGDKSLSSDNILTNLKAIVRTIKVEHLEYIYILCDGMGVCRSQATRKMVEGPPNSATRGRIQTTSGGFC